MLRRRNLSRSTRADYISINFYRTQWTLLARGTRSSCETFVRVKLRKNIGPVTRMDAKGSPHDSLQPIPVHLRGEVVAHTMNHWLAINQLR